MDKQIENKKTLKFGAAIDQAWDLTVKNFWKLLGIEIVALLFFLLISGPFIYLQVENPDSVGITLLEVIVRIVVASLLSIGSINVVLRLIDGQEISVKDLFTRWNLTGTYILAFILETLIILLGTLALIIPGIIFTIYLGLWSYFVIDKQSGPIESLKRSWRAVRGVFWKYAFFTVLMGAAGIAGFLFFIVGAFFTIPLTLIATALVYRQLAQQTPNA
jgi:hypothetical protein